MDPNLQHEDLLIKLRAKLNEDKIKLWESPYYNEENKVSTQLQNLSEKYGSSLTLKPEDILVGLKELQLHSLERYKANEEFKESGVATMRVRATVPEVKAKVFNVQKKLSAAGAELFAAVALVIEVDETRIKLICNGRVIKPGPSLEQQGIKNGAQIMALLMAENPETVIKDDKMYSKMKETKADATLLSESMDDFTGDEYMSLEDQSGSAVEVPPQVRRALMVGLALHERGRTALKEQQYPLALILLLEADEQLSECSCTLLNQVDNYAVLQLDIAWCYLCLQNLSSASDAAARLQRAEQSFHRSYGENMERLIALKGTAANEAVLIMRLYLLQGIVAYHQNKRGEAKVLLDKAEKELKSLRVDESGVAALLELGWSLTEARAGLRAAGGDLTQAHHYLEQQRTQREQARERHKEERKQRMLGMCMDGSAVQDALVNGLVSMGYPMATAIMALRNANNHIADAVRLIQEEPQSLIDNDVTLEESESECSEDSLVEPDNKLVSDLQAMGYDAEEARIALRRSMNHISGAIGILSGEEPMADNSQAPSTSTGASNEKKKAPKVDKKKRERQKALKRLTADIHGEDNDHLDTTLVQEEFFLVQYQSLL